jgi:hypothetical protein
MYTNDGEDGKRDWLRNFMFWIWLFFGGFAHFGIGRMFESSVYEIMGRILPILGNRRLTITGISQGGALATRAHDAFAAPCTWWRFFLSKAVVERASTLTTIYHRRDIVAVILLIFGYRHIGIIIKLGELAFPWWTYHTFDVYESTLKEEGL